MEQKEKMEFFGKILSSLKTLLAMNASLEEDMNATIQIAVAMGIERLCIFTLGKNEEFTLLCGYPQSGHGIKQKTVNNEGLKEIISRKKMLVIKKPSGNPKTGCTPEFCASHHINAALFIRLEIGGEPIGVLVIDAVGEKKTFDKTDIYIGKNIAHLATKELHNRRQIEGKAKKTIIELAASAIVHEFRNPLMAIGGFAGLLKKESTKMKPNQKKIKIFSRSIMEETTRLELLLAGISDMLRQKKPALKKADLSQIIEKIIAEEQRKKIYYNKEKTFAQIDEKQIELALRQIIRNAVDATEENEGEVFIRTWERPKQVCVEIANTKSYIEDTEVIFTPFYTKKTMDKGVGLGLAIAKTIVENHQGYIEVSSTKEPKCITSFKIFIPKKTKKETK